MKLKLAALLAGIALFAAAPVFAGSIVVNFGNCSTITSAHSACPSALGKTSATFTDGSYTLPVVGHSLRSQGKLLLPYAIPVTTTPEPSTLILFGTALLGLGIVSKRFRSVKA